jgi:2-iminoacetate synthase
MSDFHLDSTTVDAALSRAQAADTAHADRCLAQARRGAGLTPDEMAVLWFARRIDNEALYAAAVAQRHPRAHDLETFSPLYMTNTCDAECRMCGMRRDNPALTRETAPITAVVEQLRILQHRGMHAVALLTGEYRADNRPAAVAYVNEALRATLAMQFNHVLINVGSIDEPEFATLLAGVVRQSDGAVAPKVTMCTFQETYSRAAYAKFMGTDPSNPRADFDRRLTNFDRARRAGMRVANPGVLLGLNRDLGFELTAFALHAQHLRAHGMEVYLSVPRLRQIAGKHDQRGASDEEFVRFVSILSMGLPDCKIVITTREPASMQRQLVPIVTVLSAGSSAVAPYTETTARYRIETSQFRVIDQRPFEEILREHLRTPDARIENFDPPGAPA